MLGIVVALPWELRCLTRQTIPMGGWRAIAANTLLAVSGIGAERAYQAASMLVGQGATALVGWGSAAALDSRLRAGTLILPQRIIGANGEVYRVDSEWHRRLHRSLAVNLPVDIGPLAETDAILKSSAEKRALRAHTQAAASDMESAAAARLAGKTATRFIAIRAIVDTAATGLPESLTGALDGGGGVALGKLVRAALFQPRDYIKVARLAMQFNAAQKTLRASRDIVLHSGLPK